MLSSIQLVHSYKVTFMLSFVINILAAIGGFMTCFFIAIVIVSANSGKWTLRIGGYAFKGCNWVGVVPEDDHFKMYSVGGE